MIFHVMSKGDGGDDIFLTAADWQEFLTTLSAVKARNSFDLFAYCLMPNHFHLLIRVRKQSLSVIMQHLLTRYSKYLNSRLNRRGHVFQGRFKALLCDRDSYLLELIRYIHLNPVRANLVRSPAEWPWSGHREMLSPAASRLLDVTLPLSMFGANQAESLSGYLDFLRKDDEPSRSQITSSLLSMAQDPQADASAEGSDADESELLQLALAVCGQAGLLIDDLRGPSCRLDLSRARHAFVRSAAARGLRPSRIAAFINRTPSLVSKVMSKS